MEKWVRVADKAVFQSTPPARGATTINGVFEQPVCISIHAPREGGDCGVPVRQSLPPISIHAPREGGDSSRYRSAPSSGRFQSTPPARGATFSHLCTV